MAWGLLFDRGMPHLRSTTAAILVSALVLIAPPSYASPGQRHTAALLAADAPSSHRGGATVAVRLRNRDSKATLQIRRGGHWRVVCAAPCEASAATGEAYRIYSEDYEVRAFEVAGPGGLTVDVAPGSSAGRTAGVLMAVTGGLAAAVGFVAMPSATRQEVDYGGFTTGESLPEPTYREVSYADPKWYNGAMWAAGGSLVVAGLLVYNHYRADVTLHDGVLPSESPRADLPSGLQVSAQGLHF